jgi:hypothetical protein
MWFTLASRTSGGGGVYVLGLRRRESLRSEGRFTSREPPGRTYASIRRCHMICMRSVSGEFGIRGVDW